MPLGRLNRWEAGDHPRPRFLRVAGVFLRTSRWVTELSGRLNAAVRPPRRSGRQPPCPAPPHPARAPATPAKFVTGQRKISARTLKLPARTEPPSGGLAAAAVGSLSAGAAAHSGARVPSTCELKRGLNKGFGCVLLKKIKKKNTPKMHKRGWFFFFFCSQ